MATKDRGPGTDIIRVIQEEPYQFNFYRLVSLLDEYFFRTKSIPLTEDATFLTYFDQYVRFKSVVSLSFPASEVQDVKTRYPGEDSSANTRFEVWVNFLGLGGAFGPLPYVYTDIILQLENEKDYSLRDFLDIFNHRFVSKLYQVRRKHAITLDIRPPADNAFSRMLYAMTGHLSESARSMLPLPRRDLLFLTGIFATRIPSADGLRSILHALLKTPITLKQCIGRWFDLDVQDTTLLGKRSNELGAGALLGTRVWDQAAGLDVHAGPMSLEYYTQLLPGLAASQVLYKIARYYAQGVHEMNIFFVLQKKAIHAFPLGRQGHPRLGWTSWLNATAHQHYTAKIRLREGTIDAPHGGVYPS
ncbi:MAG: hypothetical protein A3J38_09430 [Gammaproteobacteria bacterium RIFCSPHIGHO2_12_FULL_45_9]|nr:MAG: hypothetical protein A3J38_09430 [Gammaproteobacteria bacterium RIFCSPHIGHO2_12_FULL_45_9]